MEVANRRRGVLSSASQSRPSLSGDRRAVSISWLLANPWHSCARPACSSACGCAALAEAKTAHGDPASIRSRSRPAGPNCASTARPVCCRKCATSGRKALLRLPAASSVRVVFAIGYRYKPDNIALYYPVCRRVSSEFLPAHAAARGWLPVGQKSADRQGSFQTACRSRAGCGTVVPERPSAAGCTPES